MGEGEELVSHTQLSRVDRARHHRKGLHKGEEKTDFKTTGDLRTYQKTKRQWKKSGVEPRRRLIIVTANIPAILHPRSLRMQCFIFLCSFRQGREEGQVDCPAYTAFIYHRSSMRSGVVTAKICCGCTPESKSDPCHIKCQSCNIS